MSNSQDEDARRAVGEDRAARGVRAEPGGRTRPLGIHAGRFRLPDEFDELLPGEMLAAFEGDGDGELFVQRAAARLSAGNVVGKVRAQLANNLLAKSGVASSSGGRVRPRICAAGCCAIAAERRGRRTVQQVIGQLVETY